MAYFTLKDLTFAYATAPERPALSHVDLQVEQGEYVTLCGKSGSGKTTLLRQLKTAITPCGTRTGEILLRGIPLRDVPPREQAGAIGYVMQDPDSQIVTDKVWHELAFGLESLGEDNQTIRRRVAEMAGYFGIEPWFHRDVCDLSGGQKQLLNLASVMAMQPDVLLLDEPTSQLDPIAAANFLATVCKLNRELGTTVLMVEHRLEEVFPASDRVVVMEGGRILAAAEPRQIGALLRDRHSELFSLLPAPMRIFCGVEGAAEHSPLTVREGRSWLSGRFPTPIAVTSLPEEPRQETAAPVLTAQDVWFRYEKDAPDVLRGVTFSIPAGGVHAIMGGNGAGKSTLLKCLCRACRPYRGKITLRGKALEKYAAPELYSGGVTMLPQDAQSLFVHKTVEEDLLEMTCGTEPERRAAVAGMAELCCLTPLLQTHPFDLSGGELQRAALAKVLLTKPQVLLLDEPTKGMDSLFKRRLSEIFADLTSRGVAVVLVSHDVEFCARYADTVALFFDGGVVTADTPRRFFARSSFYTTAANRMSRHVFANAITAEDVIELCQKNR